MSLLSALKKTPQFISDVTIALFVAGYTLSRLSYGFWAYILAAMANVVRYGLRTGMALPYFLAVTRKYVFAFLLGAGAELLVFFKKLLGVIAGCAVESTVVIGKLMAVLVGLVCGAIWATFGGGAQGFHSVWSSVLTLVGGPEDIGNYYHYLFRKIGGEDFLFSQFTPVFSDYCTRTEVNVAYQTALASALLGSKPYWQQTVARTAFENASGYALDQGLSGIFAEVNKDFSVMKKHVGHVLSAPLSLMFGLVASIGLMIWFWYPFVGMLHGFTGEGNERGLAGIPGALLGLARGFYKSLTFAFRNAEDATINPNHTLWDFYKNDIQELEQYSLVVFEAENTSCPPTETCFQPRETLLNTVDNVITQKPGYVNQDELYQLKSPTASS